MSLKSLKTRTISAVVISIVVSCLLVAVLVTQRYSESLRNALLSRSRNTAASISLETADLILINDLVALQKSIDRRIKSTPDIGYLFVIREGRVLANTFPQGVPRGLLEINRPAGPDEPGFKDIETLTGERYLDIAYPVFGGNAGVVRMGISENHYLNELKQLWIEIGLVTLLVLGFAVAGGLLLVRYTTSPLASLVKAAANITGEELGTRVDVKGPEETQALAVSFNAMLDRIKSHQCRLSEQTRALSRAHEQARTSCRIVQEVGALSSIREIHALLASKFSRLLICQETATIILDISGKSIRVMDRSGDRTIHDPETVKYVAAALGTLKNPKFTQYMFEPPVVTAPFMDTARQAVVPIPYGEQTQGALVIACPGDCPCDRDDIDVISTILSQCAGSIHRALLHEEELRDLENRCSGEEAGFHGLVSKDPRMKLVYKLIEDISPTDSTVLIQSESGTGKELIARAIHSISNRKDRPFVVINCSAYPSTLLESELFGHEKGAFTGAVKQRPGRFEQANGGTVFLDEIGEISPSAQIKLLRILQTQQFERLGGNKTISVDVRIIAATNKDLVEEVQHGRFREDLFYRLNVIPVHLPLLKERLNDLPYLVRHFCNNFGPQHDKMIAGVAPEAMRRLMDYPWPGNVRELENAIEHAVVLCRGDRIEIRDLPAYLRQDSHTQTSGASDERTDRERIIKALEACGWNKKKTAEKLGISRSTLYDWLKKYNIVQPTVH